MNTPLLTHLLDLLFQDPRTHSQVKDRLSDWILDRHALGLTLDGPKLVKRYAEEGLQMQQRTGIHQPEAELPPCGTGLPDRG